MEPFIKPVYDLAMSWLYRHSQIMDSSTLT